MTIEIVENLGSRIKFKIILVEGDNIEIKINTISEINKTIPAGRGGKIVMYYQEDIL